MLPLTRHHRTVFLPYFSSSSPWWYYNSNLIKLAVSIGWWGQYHPREKTKCNPNFARNLKFSNAVTIYQFNFFQYTIVNVLVFIGNFVLMQCNCKWNRTAYKIGLNLHLLSVYLYIIVTFAIHTSKSQLPLWLN